MIEKVLRLKVLGLKFDEFSVFEELRCKLTEGC